MASAPPIDLVRLKPPVERVPHMAEQRHLETARDVSRGLHHRLALQDCPDSVDALAFSEMGDEFHEDRYGYLLPEAFSSVRLQLIQHAGARESGLAWLSGVLQRQPTKFR